MTPNDTTPETIAVPIALVTTLLAASRQLTDAVSNTVCGIEGLEYVFGQLPPDATPDEIRQRWRDCIDVAGILFRHAKQYQLPLVHATEAIEALLGD